MQSNRPYRQPGADKDIRSAEYLGRVRKEKFLPKSPKPVDLVLSSGVSFSPMPLAERLRRGIPMIMMEMLLYSRPGVIEVLPALPPDIVKGSISGMLARTFARIATLAWDLSARTVDLKVTSFRNQDITLIARYGIEKISAPHECLAGSFKPGMANCRLHLPAGKTVEIEMKLGACKPDDWVAHANVV